MVSRRAVGALAVVAAATAGAATVLLVARREAILRSARRTLRGFLREMPDPVVLGTGVVLGTLIGVVLLSWSASSVSASGCGFAGGCCG